MTNRSAGKTFHVQDYNLGATLGSGQAFRWVGRNGWWEGVTAGRHARLRQIPEGIEAEAPGRVEDWQWLEDYLQVQIDFPAVTGSFPDDEPMQRALQACRGLRLLRQDPWECLASFILSSTKQIVQIRQIVAALCDRFGDEIPSFDAETPARAFPSWEQLARVSRKRAEGVQNGISGALPPRHGPPSGGWKTGIAGNQKTAIRRGQSRPH
jgi:N-glycosylase/DNA lyase